MYRLVTIQDLVFALAEPQQEVTMLPIISTYVQLQTALGIPVPQHPPHNQYIVWRQIEIQTGKNITSIMELRVMKSKLNLIP